MEVYSAGAVVRISYKKTYQHFFARPGNRTQDDYCVVNTEGLCRNIFFKETRNKKQSCDLIRGQ